MVSFNFIQVILVLPFYLIIRLVFRQAEVGKIIVSLFHKGLSTAAQIAPNLEMEPKYLTKSDV